MKFRNILSTKIPLQIEIIYHHNFLNIEAKGLKLNRSLNFYHFSGNNIKPRSKYTSAI